MKAIVQDRYGAADVLQLREVDRPAIGDHDVLVRVHAAGVDPGVWHLMTGLPYLVRMFGVGVRAPRMQVRGMALAGRVEAVGSKVTRLRLGDEVFGTGDGSFAEYARARADKLAPMPAGLTFEQAAAVPISAVTALHALRDRGKLQSGQEVLIIGAGGGVGTFAVQLARAFGARVTGVCSTAKQELVRSIGAHEAVDYTRGDLAGVSRRYDLVVDLAGLRSLRRLRAVLAPRGTLVIVGGEGGGRWFGGLGRPLLALLLSPFVRHRLRGLVSIERREDLLFLRELIEAGKIAPVIDTTYPLDQAADAIRRLESGRAAGKIVIAVAGARAGAVARRPGDQNWPLARSPDTAPRRQPADDQQPLPG